jgi:mono/diheme cytochrome c family protein
MKCFRPFLSPGLRVIALLAISNVAPAADESAEQLFVARIQPLLKTKCFACHGEDEEKIKGGLDLRTRAAMLEGGDSLIPAFVAGKPQESPIYLAATREHDTFEAMPPKDNDRLSREQVS